MLCGLTAERNIMSHLAALTSTSQLKMKKARDAFHAGKLDKALKLTKPLLKEKSFYFDARVLMLKIYTEQGTPENGYQYLQELTAVAPQNLGLQTLAGDTATKLGDHLAAMGYYLAAVGLNQADPQLWKKLIDAMHRAEAKQEAMAASEQATLVFPEHQELFLQKMKLLLSNGKKTQAEAAFQNWLELYQNDLVVLEKYFDFLIQEDDYQKIIDFIGDGLDLEKYSILTISSIFTAYNKFLMIDKAHEVAVFLEKNHPENAITKRVLMMLAFSAGEYSKVIEYADIILEKEPSDMNAVWNRALSCHYLGDFQTFYQDMHSRMLCGSGSMERANLIGEQWQGEPIEGKALLLWADHGLGDIMQLMPLIERACANAGTAIVEVQAKMVPVLKRWLPDAKVRAVYRKNQSFVKPVIPHDYDLHCPIADLQRFYLPTPEDIKAQRKIYPVSDDAVAALPKADVLQNNGRLKVGLCWRSGKWQKGWETFSPSLKTLQKALPREGVDYISLQYTKDCDEEIADAEQQYGLKVHQIDGIDLFNDIDAALALTSCCDVVVSCGSTVGDMSGILGIPTLRYGRPGPGMTFGGQEFPWFFNQRYIPLKWNSSKVAFLQTLNDWLVDKISHEVAS
jgi:tetratricopeptide (TPR) repeat protein